MQTLTWKRVYRLVREVGATRPRGSRRFPDSVVVLTYLFAAFSSRPVSWATVRGNWPAWSLRWVPTLPSSTTMSRRVRTESVRAFLAALLEAGQLALGEGQLLVVDGTALPVGRHSKDRHATKLGARCGFKRGYKLHQLLDLSGRIVSWRVTPLTVAEPVMATRMALALPLDRAYYLLGDANYDSTPLHLACASRGVQLVAPRKKPGSGRGHRPRCPHRERAILMTERPEGYNAFADWLLKQRWVVERFYGNLDSYAQGLGDLPSWVRTPRRVALWVHAKLILNAIRMTDLQARKAA